MTIPSRTQHRIDMLSALLTELGRHDITTVQAAQFLDCTRSAAKKLVRELRAAGLIKVSTYIDRRVPLFHLVGSPEQVAKFIADISVPPTPRTPSPSRALVAQCLADPSRHLHIALDDEPFIPRMHWFNPFRDGLVAALFGAPAAHGARA
jgi:hypothetical protein